MSPAPGQPEEVRFPSLSTVAPCPSPIVFYTFIVCFSSTEDLYRDNFMLVLYAINYDCSIDCVDRIVGNLYGSVDR